MQFTAVVTDGDGRFVNGLKAEDFKVFDNDRPQKITSFESENISLELVVGARRQLQHASGAARA